MQNLLLSKPPFFDRRYVTIILSAVLFVINFLFFYFLFIFILPEMTGIIRAVLCWVGAYALTWIMTYLFKGVSRFVLTLIMIALQCVIFLYRP